MVPTTDPALPIRARMSRRGPSIIDRGSDTSTVVDVPLYRRHIGETAINHERRHGKYSILWFHYNPYINRVSTTESRGFAAECSNSGSKIPIKTSEGQTRLEKKTKAYTYVCMYVCMQHANSLIGVHDKSLQGR